MSAYQIVLKSFAYLQFSGELLQTNDHALFLNVMYVFITSCHALLEIKKNIVLQEEGV